MRKARQGDLLNTHTQTLTRRNQQVQGGFRVRSPKDSPCPCCHPSSAAMPTQHKAGSLKQSNKVHRGTGGHASKRSIKRAQGGKVPKASEGARGKGGVEGASASKLQRQQQAKMHRQQLKASNLMKRRAGTRQGAPAVILLVPVGPTSDVAALAAQLRACADRTWGGAGSFTGAYDRFKFRLHVIGVTAAAGPLEVLFFGAPILFTRHLNASFRVDDRRSEERGHCNCCNICCRRQCGGCRCRRSSASGAAEGPRDACRDGLYPTLGSAGA